MIFHFCRQMHQIDLFMFSRRVKLCLSILKVVWRSLHRWRLFTTSDYEVHAGKFHYCYNVTRVTEFSVELQVTGIFIIN